MKIALLVKGQPRYTEHGAAYFRRTFVDAFPDIEFKIFVQSWMSESIQMVSRPNEYDDHNRFSQKYTPSDELTQRLSAWGAVSCDITHDQYVYRIAQQILEYNTGYDQAGSLLIEQIAEKSLFPDNGKPYHKTLLYYRSGFTETDKMSAIIVLGNLIGQYIASNLVFNQLEKYVTKHEWTPDVVWLARHDGVIQFDQSSKKNNFVSTMDYIEGNARRAGVVFVKDLAVVDGYPVVSDYNFISTYPNMNRYLGSMEQRLIDIFTIEKYRILDLLASGPYLQHSLWTKLCDRGAIIDRCVPMDASERLEAWQECVIRPPSEDYDPNTVTYDQYQSMANEYRPPSGGRSLTRSELSDILGR